MAELVAFTPLNATPKEDVVALAEELLRDARDGKVLTLAYVAEYSGFWRTETTKTRDRMRLLGSVHLLMHNLCDLANSEDGG